jgi:hypothetical protein
MGAKYALKTIQMVEAQLLALVCLIPQYNITVSK